MQTRQQGTHSGRPAAAILHVDMDAFFAAVELLERPELVNQPVAIGHNSPRSVISTANYPARRFGVHSALPVAIALQRCPRLHLIPPHMEKYAAVSKQVFALFEEFTPIVEPLSVDEAFLDVTGSQRLFGDPVTIARQLRQRIREETGLAASVGIATNKFLAKIASGFAKPDGVYVIPPGSEREFLADLPVKKLWGVGPKTLKLLESRAIKTAGDLGLTPLDTLTRLLGEKHAKHLHQLSQGIDERAVETERERKSVGHERTFEVDIVDRQQVTKTLLRLAAKTGERLRAKGLRGKTIAIKVRWAGFETVSRSHSLARATDSTQQIYAVASELFRACDRGEPIRLLGVRVEQLTDGSGEETQPQLWSDVFAGVDGGSGMGAGGAGAAGAAGTGSTTDAEQWERLEKTLDEVNARFGGSGITNAGAL